MPYKKPIKKVVRHLPMVGNIIRHRDELIREVADLKISEEALKKRNDEWAAEVLMLRGGGKAQEIVWPVKTQDIINANWLKPNPPARAKKTKPPFKINWVLPPVGEVTGGVATIMRCVQYLERQGHTCNLYIYDALGKTSLSRTKEILKSYPRVKAKIHYNVSKIAQSDAIFATNWYTAYPVFNSKTPAKKFYFVQDFEPYFDPVGAYSIFAENTYKFNLYGITIGSWLSQKLTTEYNMKCDYFEFGTDTNDYQLKNLAPRKKILFYARPVTPRRGFELGVLALEIFHKQHPDYEINFVGWDMKPYKIHFPFINNGILDPTQLNRLYNQCAAGLVLSFTNMSLLPLELMASGCVPVLNDAQNTKAVSYWRQLEYALPNPEALARKLHEVVVRKNNPYNLQKLSKYAAGYKWDNSYSRVESILERELGQ